MQAEAAAAAVAGVLAADATSAAAGLAAGHASSSRSTPAFTDWCAAPEQLNLETIIMSNYSGSREDYRG